MFHSTNMAQGLHILISQPVHRPPKGGFGVLPYIESGGSPGYCTSAKRLPTVLAAAASSKEPNDIVTEGPRPKAGPGARSNIVPLPGPPEPEPATWPSEAARKSLYSSTPVDRVDGLYAKVKGSLPKWLSGSFYRNGPGVFEGAYSVFDGCAMVIKFLVDGATNEVVLSHRFLETTYFKHYKSKGHISWRLSNGPAAPSSLEQLRYTGGLMRGMMEYGVGMGDNALISIFPHGRHLVAHTETQSGTYLVDPYTLETLGRVQYDDKLHGMVKTAHPSVTWEGDIINIAADFMPWWDGQYMRVPELTLYRQKSGCLRTRHKIASVPYHRPSRPTWIHQVPLSQNWAAIVQNPVYYNVKAMLLGRPTKFMVFDWVPEDGTLIHVVRLDGKESRSYRAPAFLATHWVNAFESGDGRFLHLDCAVTDDPAIMSHWTLDNALAGPRLGRQIPNSALRRLTIDLHAPDGSYLQGPGLLQPLVTDDFHGSSFELPAINPTCISRPYRFAYGTCAVRPTNAWNGLCKLDTHTGAVKVWHEPGAVCWEPVFVPNLAGSSEDAGVLLSTLMQADGRSALLVLDGHSFEEVARAVLPYGLPNGFHGCFVPT